MASTVLFQPSPSLKKAAELVNSLDASRYGKLLTRILQRLHLKDDQPFSEEEKEKLQGALQLEPRDIELVLDTTSFILQQAAYHLAKPAVLKQQLQNIGFTDDKASVLSQAWSSHGKNAVEKLRSRQFYPKQLEDVGWRLNLEMATSSRSKLKQPNAQFEFLIKDGEKEEKLRVDFTHSELYNFYEKLEEIQQQLDTLT